ncbi:MAG: DEAD/DEAH box helicase, partial [Leptospiraceae bacterium]|nr:DEAD/DEAH box helicase [Leptospiraceae bacterium]
MLIFPSLSGQYETITGQESAGFITTFSNLQQFILLSSQSNHHVFLHSHLADFLPCVIALVGLGLLEFTANGLREKTRPPFLGSQSGLHLAFRPSQLDFLEYLQNHVGQISPLFEGGPTSVGRSPRLTDGIDRGALKRSVAETHEDYRFQTLESENPFWNDILRRLNLSNLYTTQWEVIQKTATGQKVIVSMEPGSGKMLSVFLAAIYQVVQRFQSVLILVPNDSIADEIKIEYYSKIQDLHWMQGLSLQILTSDEERRDTGHVTALAMQELPSERQPDIILATPDRLHALLKTRHRARDFIRNLGFVGIVEASLHGFIQSFHTAMVLRRFFTMTRLVFRGRYGARWMGEDGFPELGVLVTMEACANPDAFASFLTGLDFLPSNVITASQSPVRDKNLYAIRPYQKNEDELNGPLSIFKAALRFQSLPFLLLGYGENLILADKLRIARMAEQQTGELRSRIMNSLFLESELVRGRSEAGLPNRNRLLEARTAVLNLGDDPASSAALLSAMGLFAAGEPPLVLIPIRNDQDLQRAQKVTRSAGMPNNAGSSPRQMIVPDFDERTLPVLQSHLHCLFEEMDRSFLRGYTRSDLMAFFGGGLNHRMAELIQRSL